MGLRPSSSSSGHQRLTNGSSGWQTARRHVDSQVYTVVGGKHRSSYARVAHLAAALAEAFELAANPHAAHRYLDDLHTRYPRHTSFRRELRAIVPQSPLLGS